VVAGAFLATGGLREMNGSFDAVTPLRGKEVAGDCAQFAPFGLVLDPACAAFSE
jgi:hypothetical protein